MKTPKYIEVVRSSTKKLSSLSYESALAIVESLSEQYGNVVLTIINTTNDLAALIERKPDLVFLGVKYVSDSVDPSRRVWLSEQLERADIPHTGSTSSSHELEYRKDRAKQRVVDYKLATARFYVVAADRPYNQQHIKLEFPLFVKPVDGGGGKGIDERSVVRTPEQLHEKVTSLRARYNADVLIEQYLEGREFSVAIIKDQASNKYTAMPLEIVAPLDINGERILGHEVKSLNQEQTIGINDQDERNLIITFALDVFSALGARDYGRIDIRFDSKGAPHFLEANLIPSLIKGYGSFPKAYKLNHGVEYDEMISNIALLGLSRSPTAR